MLTPPDTFVKQEMSAWWCKHAVALIADLWNHLHHRTGEDH